MRAPVTQALVSSSTWVPSQGDIHIPPIREAVRHELDVEVQGRAAALQSLQNDARVFLVDVGAVELLDQYPEASITVDDISYRYNKYSR